MSKLYQRCVKVVSQKGVSLMWSHSGPTVVPKLSPSLRQLIQVVLKCCQRSFQTVQGGVQVVPFCAKWSPFMLPYCYHVPVYGMLQWLDCPYILCRF